MFNFGNITMYNKDSLLDNNDRVKNKLETRVTNLHRKIVFFELAFRS